MTFVPDSRKPTHVQNVYVPQLKNGELFPQLAARGFKAPQLPEDFLSMLEREIFELVKKEKVTKTGFHDLVRNLMKVEDSPLMEATLERLVEELIYLPEIRQSVKNFQFPSTRQATFQEKREAKKYLEEERNLAILLEHLL